MATDHRGNIVGNPNTMHGGHRPLPRLQSLLERRFGSGTGKAIISAHRNNTLLPYDAILEDRKYHNADRDYMKAAEQYEDAGGFGGTDASYVAEANMESAEYRMDRADKNLKANKEVYEAGGVTPAIKDTLANRSHWKNQPNPDEEEF